MAALHCPVGCLYPEIRFSTTREQNEHIRWEHEEIYKWALVLNINLGKLTWDLDKLEDTYVHSSIS